MSGRKASRGLRGGTYAPRSNGPISLPRPAWLAVSNEIRSHPGVPGSFPPMSSRSSRLASFALALGLAGWGASLSAQDPTEQTGEAIVGVPVRPEAPIDGPIPDVPVPPGVLLADPPPHTAPPIPEGPFRAGPDTPESRVLEVDTQPELPGQFRYFQNQVVRPSGANTSSTGEPSVAMVRDTVFQTGNWYAARSVDAGETFTYVSPYSIFGALDGGFCCDQRVYYHEARDITIWLLQYSYSSSTQQGSYRIAIANGRADLQNPSSSAWTRYTWNPGMMGFGNGNWFDFPDMATTGDKLFVSANVFSGSGSNFQGSVVWIMDLAQMAAGQGVNWSYVTNSNLLGSTYRFAEGGPSDRLYFAAQRNTSSHYIYRITNGGSWSRVTRNVGTYSNATASAPGPDGRDWAGRVTGRFRGSFGNSSEVGFLLTSAARPTNGRPLPFTKVYRFTADDNRTLLGEHDIWSSTLAFAYATGRCNDSGHVGLVMAIGGPSYYLRSAATLIDQYQAWGGLTVYPMATGNSGPSGNRWGDYFDVHAQETYGNTFIGTGMEQNGGSGGSSNQPRFVWFGRDDYEPTWVNLDVQSTGVAGVPITIDVTDMDGRKNGSTTLQRRFVANQAYELTAPATRTSGSTNYVFERWTYTVSPGGTVFNGAIGDTTLTQSSIGGLDDLCIANYVPRRTLTIQSANPTSGVSITVTPDDINGNGNGSTSFVRYYRDGESVTLTAPASNGFNPFERWRVGRVNYPLGQRSITITASSSLTALADYYQNVPGTTGQVGPGCVGSNGRVPSHTITWGRNQQGPQQGLPTNYNLSVARPNTFASLNFGLSTRDFNGTPLPLNLAFIGMQGCTLYQDIVIESPTSTNASGAATQAVTWPVDPAAIGANLYSYWVVLDPGVPRSLDLAMSNTMRTTLGGNR